MDLDGGDTGRVQRQAVWQVTAAPGHVVGCGGGVWLCLVGTEWCSSGGGAESALASLFLAVGEKPWQEVASGSLPRRVQKPGATSSTRSRLRTPLLPRHTCEGRISCRRSTETPTGPPPWLLRGHISLLLFSHNKFTFGFFQFSRQSYLKDGEGKKKSNPHTHTHTE